MVESATGEGVVVGEVWGEDSRVRWLRRSDFLGL
jgi:hypothetical protein